MSINRREMLHGMAGGAGAMVASSLLPSALNAASGSGPKRVIFFLQTHGLNPETCIPKGMRSGGSLASKKLPEQIKALEPYKKRLHIINSLRGKHTGPSHSAFFGALGGYRGGIGTPPSGPTIDYSLSQALPQTLLPHLCIGMDSIEKMRAKPTIATLSASGAGKPIFMHSNPQMLYQMLYGGIAKGDIRKEHETRTNVFEQVERIATAKGRSIPIGDVKRYGQYVQGFKDINGLTQRLTTVSDHLRKFAPIVDDRYRNPKFETDWHDVLLDLGISALKAGLTNTLTVGSGRGEVLGAWKGLGIEMTGHGLGHRKQAGSPIWLKIRQYNCSMLVKIMQELEKVPEGSGTMMDNTLIVYTSDCGSAHHNKSGRYPMLLLGNFDGRIKTGRYTNIDHRTTNALYATLLHAATGKPVDRFNMSEKMASVMDSGKGPVKEVLI